MSWFDRVPLSARPLVEAARDIIPEQVHAVVQPWWLIDVSPHFVGLHRFKPADLGAEYAQAVGDWTYDDLAHCCFFDGGRPVVVFPRPELYEGQEVGTLVHEYGHAFDFATGFTLDCPVTTAYSKVSRAERIAEAFETLLLPPSGAWQEYMQAEAFRPLREAMGVT